MRATFLRCLLGVVAPVLAKAVNLVGCPPVTVITQSQTSVALVAGGDRGSLLAGNMSCMWVIPASGDHGRELQIGISFVRLPPGAFLTVEVFEGEYVWASSCSCPNDSQPVCNGATTYRNNCTALCLGVALSDFHPCERGQTTMQGDVPIPVVIQSEGGSFVVRYGFPFVPPPDPSFGEHPPDLALQFLQTGFNFSVLPADTCFRGCSGHGTCNSTLHEGLMECLCEDHCEGADCSVYVPVVEDGDILKVKSLCPGCWFFAQFFIANTSFIGIEVDSATSGSDPFVVASRYFAPSITRFDRAQSWVSWTDEDTQLRVVSWEVTASPELDGPYYIGVVNDPVRTKAAIDFTVTLRLGNDTYRPCIHNCSGRGVCDNRAPVPTCNCSQTSNGVYCEQTENEIKFGQFKRTVLGPVRMGQWAFWYFDVSNGSAFLSTVMVSFQSLSPRAYPFVGVRKQTPPVLDTRFLPTFDAFMADFADNEGFDLLKGQRQTVLIPAQNLSAGRYFVGVFNLWEQTGLPQTSRSDLNFTLFVDSYKVGMPCPMERGTFCGEEQPRTKCDINAGVCRCNVDELGDGCYFKARPLPFLAPISRSSRVVPPSSVPVGLADYYYLQITNGSRLNLRVFAKQLQGNATLVLLAKKDAQPFDVNFSYYDVRDSPSMGGAHTITLSYDMLTPGVWYFAVVNAADSLEALTYSLNATLAESLDCETGRAMNDTSYECSGQGFCNKTKGSCVCAPGFTGSSCSALGIPHLGTGGLSTVAQSPPIPVGKWAYWSFALPCRGVQVLIELRANTSSNPGAAPILVVRDRTLPLQLDGTYTLADYYNGLKAHTLPQAISLTACIAGKCVVNPLYDEKMAVIGTAQSIGWDVTPPGIYYIGVYNDRQLAKAPLSRYAVSVRILDNCIDNCGEGFVGIDCEQLCPGMLPIQGFGQGLPCSGQGKCISVRSSQAASYYARCVCDPDFTGSSCSLQCQTSQGVGCSGNGRCSTRNGVPYCNCDDSYRGADCSMVCPGLTANNSVCNGRGECGVDSRGVNCICDPGFAGVACEIECPNRCGGAGVCVVNHTDMTANGSRAWCSCHAGYAGETCGMTCPLGANNLSCSGWGLCTAVDGLAVCKCHGCCEDPACSTLRLRSSSDLSVLTILATVAACLFCLGLFAAVGVLTYRKRRGRSVHFVPIQPPSAEPRIPVMDSVTVGPNVTNIWRSPPQRGVAPTPPEVKTPGADPEVLKSLREDAAEVDPDSSAAQSTARGPDEQSVSFHLESLKSER